jgi:hypothetical protein
MKWTFFKSLIAIVIFTMGWIGISNGSGLAAQQAQEKKTLPPTKHYTVNRTELPIKIHGVLDEAAWEQAAIKDLPYEWFPGDNIPAVVKTECLVIFSKSKIYFGFRCFDPDPKKIRAHLMDRDTIDTFILDDHIILLLDTFNDERRAFQFRVNPLGVQADAFFSELEGFEDFSWDAIWNSAGKITDFGYSVEIAIPFNQLRFPKTQEKQTWGISAERVYSRVTRHRIKSHPVDRDRQCLLCQANKVTGFEGMSPGRNLEFDPTLTVNRTDKRPDFPSGELEKGKLKVEPGISARWGITPNLILNSTINPDFSQVEADVAQLEVNTRFALRYPEKRPFFLEGADFFLTPLEAVFTRTVYDPLWGMKMTGKMGKNAIGVFAAQDRYNNLLFPSNQGSWSTSLGQDIYSGVLRYRRDVGKGSNLGFLYTGRIGDDYYNHVAGADGFFRITQTKILTLQFLHSRTDYPDPVAQDNFQPTDAFAGSALFVDFVNWGRKIAYGVTYRDLSDKFRADYGFIPRVGLRHIDAFISPIIWSKGQKWFHRIGIFGRGQRFTNRDGDLTDQDLQLGIDFQGPLQTAILSIYSVQKEWYNGITYDKNRFQVNAEIRPKGGMRCNLFALIGDSIDYDNSRLAHAFIIQPAIDFFLSKRLNINLNHTFQQLSLQGEKIFSVNLFQAKVIYNFNIRTFARVIFQYMHLNRNPDLYLFPVNAETNTLFTQLLFAYKINPQTKLFIGYSDNHLGMNGIELTRTDRTFFLKIGYAFVY